MSVDHSNIKHYNDTDSISTKHNICTYRLTDVSFTNYCWITGEFSGPEIDADMLIDQHYYAIASKATILKPDQIPVPRQLFEESFGLSYESALADGLVFNAKDACTHLGVDAMGYVLYNDASLSMQ